MRLAVDQMGYILKIPEVGVYKRVEEMSVD